MRGHGNNGAGAVPRDSGGARTSPVEDERSERRMQRALPAIAKVHMVRIRHMLVALLFLASAFTDITLANPSSIMEKLHLDVSPPEIPSISVGLS